MKDYVVAIGGINIDIKAKSKSDFILKDSNPSTIDLAPGGVARNIAHNLAKLEIPVKLISVVGKDSEGAHALKETADAGVDITYTETLYQHRTGTYIALLNPTGEMEAAVSCMDIFSTITPDYLEKKLEVIKNSAFIVCDANIPTSSIQYLINVAAKYNIPICIEPVSVSKAKSIKNIISNISFITPNIYELEELSDNSIEDSDIATVASKLINKGVQYVITTLGEKGICVTSHNNNQYLSSYETEVRDVTGAGDSLTAGLIYGLMKFKSIEFACKCGLAAAAITVASTGTVSEDMCEQNIHQIINNSR
jgi:pseudouridine kinase